MRSVLSFSFVLHRTPLEVPSSGSFRPPIRAKRKDSLSEHSMICAACASVDNLGIMSYAYVDELNLGLTDTKMGTSVPICQSDVQPKITTK